MAGMVKKAVIEVRDLVKKYGKFTAVKGISFDVEEGEIFGIVGPNGAGKTSMVECMEGIREFNAGEIRVAGLHPIRDAARLKQKIGIQLQESQLPDRIKAREALELFAALYQKSIPWKPLVKELGLEEKMNSYYDKLSGGQKQRLSIAMALINDPEIVFFDELTTGLDPQARRIIWTLVENVRKMGKTVVLVTHFMEEAERLCDRVAIIDHGELIALDTPARLIRDVHAYYRVSFKAEEEIPESLFEEPAFIRKVHREDHHYDIEVQDVVAVADFIHLLADHDIGFVELTIHQPSLEDVFIALTGKELRE